MNKYLWWIENEDGGGVGEWPTKKEAILALLNGLERGILGDDTKWTIKRFIAEKCPSCGRLAPKEIIASLSMCLDCDHILLEDMEVMEDEV